MSEPKFKAYVVSCPGDDHGSDIHFTTSQKKARQMGNGDRCDCSYIELTAKHHPDLDQYCPGPVKWRDLLEKHGWDVFCGYCDVALHDASDSIIWVSDRAYCNDVCRSRAQARDREIARLQRAKQGVVKL